MVENTLAATLELAPFAEEPADEVTRSQRAMDRSRRATNPQNYNPDGTNKKGRKQWHKSRPYLRLEKSLAESKRKQAAERKREHGELANQCIAQSIHWKEGCVEQFVGQNGTLLKFAPQRPMCAMLSQRAASAGRMSFSLWDHGLQGHPQDLKQS